MNILRLEISIMTVVKHCLIHQILDKSFKVWHKDKGRILVIAVTLDEAKLLATKLVSAGIHEDGISVFDNFKSVTGFKYVIIKNITKEVQQC